jgi:hypothetical protein
MPRASAFGTLLKGLFRSQLELLKRKRRRTNPSLDTSEPLEERMLLAAAVLTGSFLKDAEIRSNAATTNYGNSSRVGVAGAPDQAAIFSFDVSKVPAGSTVTSASITLNVTDPSSQSYELYQMLRPWTESAVTWNYTYPKDNWGSPGMNGQYDRGKTALGTVTATAAGTVTINLNAAGIAVVQGWVNNPNSNHGLALLDYGATSDRLEFRSSEDATTSLRPSFRVNYNTPGTTATNKAPVVNAGTDASVALTQTANLNGTVTDDGLPTPTKITSAWSKVSGPGTVTFGNTAAIDTTARFSAAGTYVLKLTANDGAIASSDQVMITVGSGSTPTPTTGIWISQAEIMKLPMSGEAWTTLNAQAQGSTGTVSLSDQNSDADTTTLAKALVGVRTNNQTMISQVRANIMSAINTENGGETLALGRNLVSYIIAADIVKLSATDDAIFKTWLRGVLNETLSGRTLTSTHEDRPNNWGTHAGASRIAAALYLGDRAMLDQAAKVFKGWVGDRTAYSGFNYGDLDWQSDASRPVGINPKGATKDGRNIDGALPEEMRRGGPFQWPPAETSYPWEAMQGAVVQAELLHRAGYDAYNWQDKAVLRAAQFLNNIGWPAEADDEWIPWLLNRRYGTNFQTFKDASEGKNMAWTAWTHQPGFNLTLDASLSTEGEPVVEDGQLTDETLAAVVEQASQAWVAELGDEAAAQLENVDVQITDLPEGVLGHTIGDTVFIDRDAAGLGWFVDSTPEDSEEFQVGETGELTAEFDSPAVGLVDLQTVVAHELGHVLGMDHTDELDVMHESISEGVRRAVDGIVTPIAGLDSHESDFGSESSQDRDDFFREFGGCDRTEDA